MLGILRTSEVLEADGLQPRSFLAEGDTLAADLSAVHEVCRPATLLGGAQPATIHRRESLRSSCKCARGNQLDRLDWTSIPIRAFAIDQFFYIFKAYSVGNVV